MWLIEAGKATPPEVIHEKISTVLWNFMVIKLAREVETVPLAALLSKGVFGK